MTITCRINGKQRKEMKKLLSLLKRDLHRFWDCYNINADMHNAYGYHNPVSREDAQRMYDVVSEKVSMIERDLAETTEGGR